MRLAVVSNESCPLAAPTAEQRIWAYYVTERSKGPAPTGAELDRIAGTNNYGRRLLREWRRQGRITDDAAVDRQRSRSVRGAFELKWMLSNVLGGVLGFR
ncbi:hypothetical protein [Amycolatopsis thermoflava]|uniref:hypothetical protein n=1 Tax=Amycolatopsis thermoflava TaxID=84480 RepID=UPI00366164B3